MSFAHERVDAWLETKRQRHEGKELVQLSGQRSLPIPTSGNGYSGKSGGSTPGAVR